MKHSIRTVGAGLFLMASLAGRSAAQGGGTTAEQLRNVLVEDSLTPTKTQLRNFVAELRDTLNSVQALHARITRNVASGMNAVVRSDGRELGKRCRVGGAAADLTITRVEIMRTSDPRGDQAMNSYRVSLSTLIDDLRLCQHDDSVAMAAAVPDPKQIERVSAAASDAVARYDAVRDALMKLLNINLPVKGNMRPR